LQGLAYAHDAGCAHGDPQLHNVLIDARGRVSSMGLAALEPSAAPAAGATRRLSTRGMAVDPAELRSQQMAAERDVLACAVLLHQLLAGEAPFGLVDTARVIERMAPVGNELLELRWNAQLPVAEALRAIVNRATSSQPRLRYRSARTLLNALTGWRLSDVADGGGPVALLLDRLATVGHLPALPGLGKRVSTVLSLAGRRAEEMVDQILPDLALSFELLRMMNTRELQETQVAGNGIVLALRRVVSLVGVDGVRKAASSLRPWPGSLDEEAALQLAKIMERVQFAGYVAQALRPPGYDAEVVFMIAAMQNLGRLMLYYHFADEAAQIEQLTHPADAPTDPALAHTHAGGLSEEAAAYAVFGADVEAFGFAVARHWGFPDEVQHMIRRLPRDTLVRAPDNDIELLRVVASAANEVVEIAGVLPAGRNTHVFDRLVERYARVLPLTPAEIQDA
jgi:non-specific serine/threonine protein kinase